MFTEDFDIAEGLIYLKYIYNVISKMVYTNVREDIPLENLVYSTLNSLIRNYKTNHEIDKHIFSRFPQKKLEKIEQVCQLVIILKFIIIL